MSASVPKKLKLKHILFADFIARRFEKEIKEVLEVYSQDRDKKEQLLTGRRVHLAEELSKYLSMLIRLSDLAQLTAFQFLFKNCQF